MNRVDGFNRRGNCCCGEGFQHGIVLSDILKNAFDVLRIDSTRLR